MVMNKRRAKAEKIIIEYIGKLTNEENKENYIKLFKSYSDEQFDKFMTDLRDKKNNLQVIVRPGETANITVENNFKIAKELGYEFFQRLTFSGDRGMEDYVTPNKYLVYKLPIRRVAQLQSKKSAIPTSNKKVDLLTGQVTGEDRGAKLTLPELLLLEPLGLQDSLVELMKVRGGDLGAMNAADNMLYKYGRASLKEILPHSTGVVSTRTVSSIFKAAHIRPTGLD